GVARGRDTLSPEALAVYGRIGLHPLAAVFGAGAVCLLSAAALAFSAPIRAYWDGRRVPGPEEASVPPSGGSPPQVSNAAVAQAAGPAPGRPPGEGCLACGARMPEDAARCASCGWTYSASEDAEPCR